LAAFEIPLPPITTQRKISAVLSAYDDLVENNNRRIKILEEMAQRIYREWFVDFRYPRDEGVPLVDSELGPIPSDWSIVRLFDVAEVTFGFPFASVMFNTDEGVPVVRIRDVLAGETKTRTLQRPDARYLIEDGDILVGMDGEFHMGIWGAGDAWLNQRVARIRTVDPDVCQHALFWALRAPIARWNKAIAGTTVAHLGKKHLEEIALVRPPTVIAERANRTLDPMLKLILTLKKSNVDLRMARDLLLPRLVAGELDVTDLDIATPEAA
jgi:type I restriction enzyme S subunit